MPTLMTTLDGLFVGCPGTLAAAARCWSWYDAAFCGCEPERPEGGREGGCEPICGGMRDAAAAGEGSGKGCGTASGFGEKDAGEWLSDCEENGRKPVSEWEVSGLLGSKLEGLGYCCGCWVFCGIEVVGKMFEDPGGLEGSMALRRCVRGCEWQIEFLVFRR